MGAGTAPQAAFGKRGRDTAVFQAGLCIAAICSIVLVFELITAFRFSWDIFSALGGYVGSIFIITPVPTAILSISGAALQFYYVFLLAAMGVSVVYILCGAVGPLSRFARDRDSEAVKNTALFEMAVLFAALYAIQFAFILLVQAAGVDTESPIDDSDLIALMYSLLNAAVWEEVVSRVLLIGVPMLFAGLIVKKEGAKWWRYLIGGFGMSRGVIIFIFFSAAMFGLAHVPGWDLWKFVPTFLFGLIAGYLFVKYGVYATIAMHFLTNYLMSSDWMFGDGGVTIGLVMFGVMILGIPYVWVYSKRGFRYLRDSITR